MNRFRRLHRDDEGASLILVLAFLLAFTLIVPALLGLAQTNVMSVAKTRAQGNQAYDADAVAQQAINDVRNSTYNNGPGQSCFPSGAGRTSALVGTSLNDATPTLVTCQPGDGTGDPSTISVPITTTNTPGTALLTLSENPGEEGVQQNSNNTFRIRGRVYSHSTIKVGVNSAQLLDENAPVYAKGACTSNVVGQPTTCNDGTNHASLGTDPGYALPTLPTATPAVPSCSGTGKHYTLSPGYYTNALALSALNKSSCSSSVTYFSPGVYYFDFQNSGSHVWSVSSGYVVGGTPMTTGARAWSPSTAGSTPSVPGACRTPLEPINPATSTDNGGVEFVFGGDSQLSVTSGAQFEVCGQYSATVPPIALYGVGTGTAGANQTAALPIASTSDDSASIKFANKDNVKVSGSGTADAAFDPTATGRAAGTHAAMVATVAAPSPAIPAGKVLVSATLSVQHRDLTGTTPITALNATLTPNRTPSPPVYSPSNTVAPTPTTDASSALKSDSWDFTSALAADFAANGFTGANLTVSADVAGNSGAAAGTAKEQLDYLVLTLVYRNPGYRAQDVSGSCTGNGTYPSGAGCATVSASGPNTSMYFQGTTYVPKGALDITLNNVSEQVFKFGVICRTLQFSITGSSSFDEAVISVPDYTPGSLVVKPVDVYFQVFLCPSGSCSAPPSPLPANWQPTSGSGWVRRVSAVASYTDPTGTPVAGSRQVTVKSWYSRREGT